MLIFVFQMDRVRLLPMQLPPASSMYGSSGNSRGKISFVRRLTLAFIILACLGLLYVPAYHSAQGQFSGLGETPSPVGPVGGTHFIASVGMHSLMLCGILSLKWFTFTILIFYYVSNIWLCNRQWTKVFLLTRNSSFLCEYDIGKMKIKKIILLRHFAEKRIV